MKRRVAAGATAVLAATWVVVVGVKLSSGLFGRETRKLELAHPSQGHEQVVTIGVCALVIVCGVLLALIVLAERIWRGSRRSEQTACILIALILIVTTRQAIKEKTNVAQWLGVTLDLAALVLIALALRRSDITTSGAKIPVRT